MRGYGWCVLRSSREPYRDATVENVDAIDDLVDAADVKLWTAFRELMESHQSDSFKWQFHEQNNWDRGILLFTSSPNHRASWVWDMMRWIAENGPGSYGLFYVHDDEDLIGNKWHGRGEHDFSNEFRVHRIANGQVIELADPFLSPIFPTLNPSDWT